MIFRCTDIETVPDETTWTRGEPAYKLAAGGRVLSLDGTSTFEPRVVEAEPFPPPQACRVVAISYVDVGFDVSHDPRYWLLGCYSECSWAPGDEVLSAERERDLLDRFGAAMSARQDVHLVTWNGRTFDLPVISMRSLRHGVSCGWYYQNREVRYRYSTEGHCDLMDFMSDYGASRQMKLNDACKIVGLPGKTDMSGDQVDVLYREVLAHPERSAELAARVARYCQQDTLQTALVFVRTRYHLGKLSLESHDATVRTFRDSDVVRAAIDVDWDKLMLSRPGAVKEGLS